MWSSNQMKCGESNVTVKRKCSGWLWPQKYLVKPLTWNEDIQNSLLVFNFHFINNQVVKHVADGQKPKEEKNILMLIS